MRPHGLSPGRGTGPATKSADLPICGCACARLTPRLTTTDESSTYRSRAADSCGLLAAWGWRSTDRQFGAAAVLRHATLDDRSRLA
jgi:hypothetical protein